MASSIVYSILMLPQKQDPVNMMISVLMIHSRSVKFENPWIMWLICRSFDWRSKIFTQIQSAALAIYLSFNSLPLRCDPHSRCWVHCVEGGYCHRGWGCLGIASAILIKLKIFFDQHNSFHDPGLAKEEWTKGKCGYYDAVPWSESSRASRGAGLDYWTWITWGSVCLQELTRTKLQLRRLSRHCIVAASA